MSKGITPIITVLLLLLIGVVLVGFAFAFFSDIFKATTRETETTVEQQLISAGKNVRIENVNGNNVTLRNMGTQNILNSDISFYVENTQVSFSGPSALQSSQLGNYLLNNSQLAMLPDPADLKITLPGVSIEKNVGFYSQNYVGYWKFDDGSGIIVKDSSGKGNDGTCFGFGAQCNWTTGKYGSGISFDGIDDYINIPNSS